MPAGHPAPAELMRTLLSSEAYAKWEREQETRREFWRTLNGPAERPLGSNADEWRLFLGENKYALDYLAVQIATAIEEAERRGRSELEASLIAIYA